MLFVNSQIPQSILVCVTKQQYVYYLIKSEYYTYEFFQYSQLGILYVHDMVNTNLKYIHTIFPRFTSLFAFEPRRHALFNSGTKKQRPSQSLWLLRSTSYHRHHCHCCPKSGNMYVTSHAYTLKLYYSRCMKRRWLLYLQCMTCFKYYS